jgi:hypothetical protein
VVVLDPPVLSEYWIVQTTWLVFALKLQLVVDVLVKALAVVVVVPVEADASVRQLPAVGVVVPPVCPLCPVFPGPTGESSDPEHPTSAHAITSATTLAFIPTRTSIPHTSKVSGDLIVFLLTRRVRPAPTLRPASHCRSPLGAASHLPCSALGLHPQRDGAQRPRCARGFAIVIFL